MKKFFVTAAALCASAAFSQSVGINTTAPAATLDVVGHPAEASQLDGIIAPRITSAQLSAKNYTSAQDGALVYVKDNAVGTAQASNVSGIGYYYFSAGSGKWMRATPAAWNINGNTGTSPQNNYLGTNDANALAFKVNNTNAGYISPMGTTTGGNIALGVGAMQYANAAESAGITFNSNVAIGVNSMGANATGQAIQNVALGPNSLSLQTTGSTNVAIGSSAMKDANNGNSNVAVGVSALQALNGSSNGYNVAIGYRTARYMASGQHNVFIGSHNYSENGFITSGTRNIFLGQNVGQGFHSGDQNIAIGSSVALADATNNQLNIGSVIYGTGMHGGNPKITITPSFAQATMPVPTENFDVNGTTRLRNLPQSGTANAIYTSGPNTSTDGRSNTFTATRTVVADANGVLGSVPGLLKTAAVPPADNVGTGKVGTAVSLGVSSTAFVPSLITFVPASTGGAVGYNFTKDGNENWVLNFVGENTGTAVYYDVLWISR